ncbi:DUF6479 family protein [Streptomyces sp. NPDC048057]|uniref:DUF6479 family protein n=1 Tax=Streptomyces sp. NPDC048057 TaxID=3155628 RepID=UPI0033C3A2F7
MTTQTAQTLSTALDGVAAVGPLLAGVVVVALLIGMVQLGIRKRRRRSRPPRPDEQPQRPDDVPRDGGRSH